MAFGAAGLDFFGRDPCLSPADQANGFWCRRFRNIWTSTEKARMRVYCTGLRASWSELAHARSLCASESQPELGTNAVSLRAPGRPLRGSMAFLGHLGLNIVQKSKENAKDPLNAAH